MTRRIAVFWLPCASILLRILRSDFKNHFQLDRHPEWQTCHAEHDPSLEFLFPENVYQHFRSRIGNAWMFPEIAICGDRHAKPDYTAYLVE